MAYSSGYSNPFGFTITPWVKRLLIANVAVFLVTLPFSGIVEYLAFRPNLIAQRPWTPVTYLFVHLGVFHLLFNMLGLFFFGPPLEERWGSKELLKFYAVAGLGGAALSFVFWDRTIAGASGAIYGIMVAFAMFWPDNPIYIWGIFPVKAKWLVAFLVGLSLFYAISGSGGTAHLAHLGGAAMAFLYLKSRLAPSPWGDTPKRTSKRGGNLLAKLSGQQRKLKPVETTTPAKTVVASAPRRKSLDDVDRILEKISEDGISSLTAEERRMLEEASRNFRSN